MTSTPTPGPWTLDRRDWMDRPSQDIYVSGGAYEDEDGCDCAVGVAIVVCSPSGEVVGNANARLIAAAPDLLAACRAASDLLGDLAAQLNPSGAPSETHLIPLGVREQLEAALAKAEGGAE